MPFKKGESGNPVGRPKGSLNKVTQELREQITQAIDTNKICEMLNQITNPIDYINAITKLLPYAIGKVKPADFETSDIEPISIHFNIGEHKNTSTID